MRVFAHAVLPAQSAQVPVLANNVTLYCREERPCYNGVRFFPVPKRQGRQVCFIAHPHPRNTSRDHSVPDLARASALSSAAYIATTAVYSVDQIRQGTQQERSHISTTLHIKDYGLY